jgi:hypothetical protein
VHATVSEAFKLYARGGAWRNAPAHFGHTGWPCCARGISDSLDSSSEALVRGDLSNALPANFSGTVWLLFTNRAEHWWGRADDPRITLAFFREKGCKEIPQPAFRNIWVSSFECKDLTGNR